MVSQCQHSHFCVQWLNVVSRPILYTIRILICEARWCTGHVRYLAAGGLQVRIHLKSPRRDHGQVLHSQLRSASA
jgi:hypothetical protein